MLLTGLQNTETSVMKPYNNPWLPSQGLLYGFITLVSVFCKPVSSIPTCSLFLCFVYQWAPSLQHQPQATSKWNTFASTPNAFASQVQTWAWSLVSSLETRRKSPLVPCSVYSWIVNETKGFSIHDTLHATLEEEEIFVSKKTWYCLLRKYCTSLA